MTRTLLTAAALAVMTIPAGTLQAQEASWIHVRVDEAEGAEVRVNLPVSLVDVAVETATDEAFDGGRFAWDEDADVTVEELRRMWDELRGTGEADLVEVRDGDEHVRVFRRDGRVHVHVDEDGTEKVRVVMPDEVADALLDTEGESLDLRGALRQLARGGSRELVRVRDRDASVRVWIDGRSGQAEAGATP